MIRLKLKTRVYELAATDSRFSNLTELAKAMGISTSQVYRVLQGQRDINSKFIIGATRAFPNKTLGDLFYVEKGGA